jgi:hypothetical protein
MPISFDVLAGAESTEQDEMLLILLAIMVDAPPKSRELFTIGSD